MATALGAQKWLSIGEWASATDAAAALKARGYVVVGTDLAPGAEDVRRVRWADAPHALVFGNEERGMSDEAPAPPRHQLPARG